MTPSQISMTVDQLRKLQAGGKVKARFAGASKYHAKPQRYQGQHFASKAELAFKLHLDHLKALGRVAWYTRQVPFYLPGREATPELPAVPAQRYVCDFLVVRWPTVDFLGRILGLLARQAFQEAGRNLVAYMIPIIDVKGQDTPNSKTKRNNIMVSHGVNVEVITATYKNKVPCFTWGL